MSSIELQVRINQLLAFYHKYGLWNDDVSNSLWIIFGWKICYLLFHLALPISFICAGIFNDEQRIAAFPSTLGVSSLALLVLTLRLAYILWWKNEILQFVREIDCPNSVSKHIEDAPKKLKQVVDCSLGMLAVTTLTCVISIVFYSPIFTGKKMLPYNAWCPMDCRNHPISYWIAYVYVSLAAIVTCTVAWSDNLVFDDELCDKV